MCTPLPTPFFAGGSKCYAPAMKYSQSYQVRFTESDRLSRLTPIALFNYFQETAVQQGESVALPAEELNRRGYAWVLNRIHVEIDAYPLRRDCVTVTTWANCLQGLYAIREWTMTDAAGKCLARTTSRWVLIDLNRKRAIRLPAFMVEGYGEVDERAIDDPFARPENVECKDHARVFHVRASDLDANQHANSACYIDWCLEAVPVQVLQTHAPRSFEIIYKREAVLGSGLIAASKESTRSSPGKFFEHRIHLEGEKTLLTIGKSHWIENEKFGIDQGP